MRKALIFSAPSGAGKSTIVQHLLKRFPQLSFSISATTRLAREGEANGVHYNFLSVARFKELIEQGAFLEWEEVYDGLYYGSLKSEITRLENEGKVLVFDVDVLGGISLKTQLGDEALSVFIQAPSVDELKNRLEKRGKESMEQLETRIAKADQEIKYSDQFDVILINEDLSLCLEEAEALCSAFTGLPRPLDA